MSLAIISCHFNFADYSRPKSNLRRFMRHVQHHGPPVFGVEIYLRGQQPTTAGIPGWVQHQVPRNAIMWQKEALLNMAERLVPPAFDKLAWVDADLWFSAPNWWETAAAKLDEVPVIQPFSDAVLTGRDGEIVCRKPAMAAVEGDDITLGHVGFAWAARRTLWSECGGLFPWAITGRGDILAFYAFRRAFPTKHHLRGIGPSKEALLLYEAWHDGVRNWAKGGMGYIEGEAWHDWHGSHKDRAYNERHDIILELNPVEHLRQAPQGWLEWSNEANPAMMLAMEGYFAKRREDGAATSSDL